MIGPPNFQGTLLGSMPNDSVHFQTDWTIFTKKFIFVHFGHCRNHRPFESILAAGNDRTHCPLRIGTISSPIERKLEPGELASTFVSILYQRLDGLVSKWMIWSTDQTGRGRAT